ncbi:MAG: M15 family metallopeptidase [Bacteroidota bacterium]|nr:M15 family metallopeptidase [Bacteroidota bacterium]
MSVLDGLNPIVKQKALELLAACTTHGIEIQIIQGFRSIVEQNKLYEQGRSTTGNIVTNAKGGESYHNYGLAFDFVPLIHGVANWKDARNFFVVGEIAEKIGLVWGGRWKLRDLDHCQYTFGLTIADLKAGKMPNIQK